MAVDINGALIESSGAGVKLTANGLTGLNFDGAGYPRIPIANRRCSFVAQGTADWTNYTAAAWNDIVLPYVVWNSAGNDYTPGNGRFTAPVSGLYFFTASTYTQKYPTTSPDGYTHPIFRVNNSYTYKQASYTTPYRLRSRTYYDSSYSTDTQISDILYLSVGDWVNYHIYVSTSLRYYPPYSIFSGYLIG